MGAYLSTPCVEKKSEDFTDSDNISYGVSGMQGWRISMEDAHTCTPDLDKNISLFGVYDGHGGSEVATYCALHFSEVLKSTKFYQDGDYENALKETFMKIDKELTKPETIQELKVLVDRNPEDGPPTEEDFKNKEEEETYDEDETKLLYEEATMSIEELLARYGNKKDIENEEKEIGENKPDEKGSSASSTECSSKQKTATKRTSNTSLNAVPLKESPGTSSCNGKTDSENPEKVKPTKVLPTKVKPSSSASAVPSEEDESDSDDGFDSDEAVEGSSDSESESLDDEEGDEEDDDEDVAEFPVTNPTSMVEEPGSDSGTTAVVAVMHKNTLYVANAGDSRCVLSRGGKALDMSEDHKPEDEKESQRISAAGGHVNPQGRVNGGLNLSRAIGDHCYKANKEIELKDQMITAMPDVQTIHLQPGDSFLVLACDGIWNVFSSQEVVDFVSARFLSEDAPQKDLKLSSICEELFDLCLAPDTMGDGTGCDNMTCIIVKLNQEWLEKCVKENPPPVEEESSPAVTENLSVNNGSRGGHERGDEAEENDKLSAEKSLNIPVKTKCISEVQNAHLASKRPRTGVDDNDSAELNETALKRPKIENQVAGL